MRSYRKKYPEKIKQLKDNWRQKNKEYIKKHRREYYLKNRQELIKYSIQWAKENPIKARKYSHNWKEKNKECIQYKLNQVIASAIWFALKGNKNRRNWEKLVGYTLENLMKHLENQFDDKMNWQNYGSYWEIDHKKPKSLFGISELQECWALKNLQPLEKSKNRRKFNHYEEKT